MQPGFELIFLFAGLLLGAGSAWLIATFRIGALRSQLTTASQVEITELRERLRGHEVSLTESRSRVQQLEARKNELEHEVRKLSEQWVASAQAATEVPRLQEQLAEKPELQKRIAELEITLQKERQVADEKLNLLNEAQAKLSDAFKALSSDAKQQPIVPRTS